MKKYPKKSVGFHLTLNSEWKHYRWGPLLGQTAVPGIVNGNGYFLSSTSAFLKSRYKLDEAGQELTAKVERAIHSIQPMNKARQKFLTSSLYIRARDD